MDVYNTQLKKSITDPTVDTPALGLERGAVIVLLARAMVRAGQKKEAKTLELALLELGVSVGDDEDNRRRILGELLNEYYKVMGMKKRMPTTRAEALANKEKAMRKDD